ncbi:MAG: hypothetical protein JW965_00545 [Bacteroidales bacterium]|nr:hypothetical protein [Bacteroidales bacterium]
MKLRSFFLIMLTALVMTWLNGCKQERKQTTETAVLVSEYITGHTSGQISRSAQLLVKFTNPVVPDEQVGVAADKKFMDINPAVEGHLIWSDASTLVFTPENKFEWGKEYDVRINLERIFKERARVKEYSFSVFTPEKNFIVDISGLAMPDDDNTIYFLSGELTTSDEFDIQEVESLLTAIQNDDGLLIDWDHQPAIRKHNFTVRGIIRTEEESEVMIKWNGKKAGVSQSGQIAVKVPSLKDFRLLASRAVNTPAQYMVIEFSDIISKTAELTGLVSIEGNGVSKIERENNVLRIFPSARLSGRHKVIIDGSLSNSFGYQLGESVNIIVDFGSFKPAVRLPGDGVIVPSSGEGLIFPFEAVNLRAVDVRITQIFSNNIHSFLQDNDMDGQWQIDYVGRVIKRRKVDLVSDKLIDYGRWNYFTIDLASMIDVQPGAIYRVEIGFRMSYSLFPCEEKADTDGNYYPVTEETDDYMTSYSRIYYDNYYNWQLRDDPCSQAYYSPDKFVSRNILGSNFGIITKRDANRRMNVIITNLKTAMPESEVTVEAYDFQNQLITTVKTDQDGFASFDAERNTFLLVARKNENTGYLKTGDGSSLSLSNFDVSGNQTNEGLKGLIYGERGVWRPGDSVFVAFILEDKQGWIPHGHPIIMEVHDARGQAVERITRTRTERVIYPLYFKTGENDPTGNWYVTVRIGGTGFTKWIRVETVKPNRLKINFDFDSDILTGNKNYRAALTSRWLHGTPASGMKAQITASFRDISTSFSSFSDYVFDAPFGESYYPETDVFEGTLDEKGEAMVNFKFIPNSEVNNMLNATFITRVFEPGGDFSINRFTKKISPFNRYVGFKIPWSDPKYQKLNTDEDHSFDVITVDENGNPVSSEKITVKVYKLEWRYWWSSSYENLASYAGRTYHDPVYTTTVITGQDGRGSFMLNIPRSRWGRYLILADLPSANTAGSVVYFDWPYGRTESAGGAEMLMVSTNQEKYNVGETVIVSFPAGTSSSALVSIENGSKVLKQEWINNIDKDTKYEFKAQSEMSPNVYVHVSLINPHSQTANDLPIRMYGIAPVMVEDPASHLEPIIDMPDKLKPEEEFRVKIKENKGRAMDYYFALVDEGLLDLTGFKTPDPWPEFYSKEALGVKTWDMYRYVLGVYGGELERMFAIGGDEAAIDPSKSQGRRFEPVVKVIGPYRLEKGKTAEHRIMMPQYIGSVRAMLVAADGKAYGSAEKTVPVSNPLMVLGTLPRVIGPGEKIKIPVSVFAMEEGLERVSVEVETNDLLQPVGPSAMVVEVEETGEYDIEFDYAVAGSTGKAVVNITARAGRETARHDIFIDVRNPNPPETRYLFKPLEAGEKWNIDIEKFGVEGTNSARLEVSGILPLNLEKRLDYLIQYPHGCIEQVTSAVFPQLFIGSILEADPGRKEEMEMNIKDGIDELRHYQLSSGGMSFWPGSASVSDWGSVYTAHFMVRAGRAGYTVPAPLMNRLLQFIRTEAGAYTFDATKKYMQVTQAYRLYVLAEAGNPLTGAMNRLRERGAELDMTALWFLAGSYALSGRTEVAYELIDLRELIPQESYRETYGTRERNMAVVLNVLSILDEKEQAFSLARELSEILSSERWLSTQTTAWCLVAMTNFIGDQIPGEALSYSVSVNGVEENYRSENAINNHLLDFAEQDRIKLVVENLSGDMIYATAVWKGTPLAYSTTPEKRGLDLSVQYLNREGKEIDPGSVIQGSDFKVIVSVRNTGMYSGGNIALSQIFPSGWEIMNTRLFEGAVTEENSSYDYRDIRDDRVYTYFSLEPNQAKRFELTLTAAYEGEYILPAVVCEDMYDNSFFARTAGMTVKVIKE